MSAITNLWRQLVQRRLWPVAILLVAALAAVPLALAKEPDPPAAPSAVNIESGESALAVQPIVALATPADRSTRRKVLGARKNPFGLAETQESASATPPDSNGSTTATEPSSSAGSSPSPSTGGGSAPAPVTTPTAPPKTYAMHELTVRFGDSSGTAVRTSLKRLQPLPSPEAPALIYLGVLKDGKTAVFLLDHGVAAVGDGDCRPSGDECETLRMKAGDTEFLDVTSEDGAVSAQYQLDLVKIHKSTTASASRAQASSRAGRRLLKARVSSDGPTGYRWDAATGALERRRSEAIRATFAGAAVYLP